MALPIDTYVFPLVGISRLSMPVGGLLVHCADATWPFDISIDGAPRIPFAAGALLSPKNPDGTPYKFSNIEVFSQVAFPGDNVITLLVGNVDYRGAQAIAAGQYIRSVPALTISTAVPGGVPDIVLTGGDDAIVGVNVYRKFLTAKNNSALNTVALNTLQVDSAAGKGFVLGPGESVEWEYKGQLYAKGTAGQTIRVLEFVY